MNSTKKSLEISKDRRPFWRHFFSRGTREIQIGQLSAVYLRSMRDPCSEQNIKMATVAFRRYRL